MLALRFAQVFRVEQLWKSAELDGGTNDLRNQHGRIGR